MLMTIVIILVSLWAIGFFVANVGGGVIHILLAVALIVFIYNMATNRRTV